MSSLEEPNQHGLEEPQLPHSPHHPAEAQPWLWHVEASSPSSLHKPLPTEAPLLQATAERSARQDEAACCYPKADAAEERTQGRHIASTAATTDILAVPKEGISSPCSSELPAGSPGARLGCSFV